MEAENLPDGRIRLVLSNGENHLVDHSLSAASSVLGNDPESRARVGVSAEEARSFDDDWSIVRRRVYGPPSMPPLPEEARQRFKEYLASLPIVPRLTGTAWDDLPRMEVEKLPDGRIVYTLARGELALFAEAIDEMLRSVVRDKDTSSRGELNARSGRSIEEFEALRDELWRADHTLRGVPEPAPRYDPPRPRVASGRVGDVDSFVTEHRPARARSRGRDPVVDERVIGSLLADGRARIVVETSLLQQLYDAFWPWHSMYWEEPGFVGPGDASILQAQELRRELSNVQGWLDEEYRERWAARGVTLCEVRDGRIIPRRNADEYLEVWGKVPLIEAEVLPNGRLALILPLVKLRTLVGYMEVSLIDKNRYRHFFRDFTEAEAEALTDELWQAYDDLTHELARREQTGEEA